MVTKKKRPGAATANGPETAAYQQQTRLQHAQERAQDYVQAIADLIHGRGEARATDLAKSLGVTHVTVIRTVQRLQREGLVTTQPYRSIFLTDSGRRLAGKARARRGSPDQKNAAGGVRDERHWMTAQACGAAGPRTSRARQPPQGRMPRTSLPCSAFGRSPSRPPIG